MAEKRRFYDLWLVEANTVYREVPFNVVADWVQQGRLLEDDMLRPAGTTEWRRLGDFMDFRVYVPKPPSEPEPPSAVEPMEPVEPGFAWRRRSELEESEVDMIPLIDVSLVLLIFFMLTTKDVGGGQSVPTPPAEHGVTANATPDSFWVGVNFDENHELIYTCGVAGGPAVQDPDETPEDKNDETAEDKNKKREEKVLHKLQNLIASYYEMPTELSVRAQNLIDMRDHPEPNAPALAEALHRFLENRNRVELTIDANPAVESGKVRRLTVDLSHEPFHSEIGALYTGVSDKKP